MNPIEEFQKRAAAAGLSVEQIAAFIKDNQLETKLAAPTPQDFFAAVISEANVEKTAQSLAYTEGFLKQAADRGLSPEEAVQVTKTALALVFPVIKAEKQAAEQPSTDDAEKTAYFTGMFEKAAAYGLTPTQTAQLIEKFAAPGFMPGGGNLGGVVKSMLPRQLELGLDMGAKSGMGAKLMNALKASGKATGIYGTGLAGGLTANMLNSSTPTATAPGLMEQLKQMISQNPELAGAIGGAGVGGVLGGISGLPGDADPNDPTAGQSHVGRNALLGALAMGGAGAGAGHFAPDMFKRLAA